MSRGLRSGHIAATCFPAGDEAMVPDDVRPPHQSSVVRADGEPVILAGED